MGFAFIRLVNEPSVIVLIIARRELSYYKSHPHAGLDFTILLQNGYDSSLSFKTKTRPPPSSHMVDRGLIDEKVIVPRTLSYIRTCTFVASRAFATINVEIVSSKTLLGSHIDEICERREELDWTYLKETCTCTSRSKLEQTTVLLKNVLDLRHVRRFLLWFQMLEVLVDTSLLIFWLCCMQYTSIKICTCPSFSFLNVRSCISKRSVQKISCVYSLYKYSTHYSWSCRV